MDHVVAIPPERLCSDAKISCHEILKSCPAAETVVVLSILSEGVGSKDIEEPLVIWEPGTVHSLSVVLFHEVQRIRRCDFGISEGETEGAQCGEGFIIHLVCSFLSG